MKTILTYLKEGFPSLHDQELVQRIAEKGRLMKIEIGDELVQVGDRIRFVPLICEGLLKVIREDEEGNELFLYFLYPGQTCAMSINCCQAGQSSTVRVVAEEPTTLIGVPSELIDEWTRNFQEWKMFIMHTQQDRFNELLYTLDSIAFKQLDQRLLEYLTNKSKATNHKVLSVTHQEIANDLNSSREVISRLLKQMEKSGKIILTRNQVELV